MGCNCKDNRIEIAEGREILNTFRELFMTMTANGVIIRLILLPIGCRCPNRRKENEDENK